MFRPQAIQPTLFDRSRYIVQVSSKPVWPTPEYRRWWCSPRHDRQRYEALVRQNFRCWHCGKMLNPRWYDVHHANGYENLGYEEASDLVAVHRRCHQQIEEAKRTMTEAVCGCTARPSRAA